MKPLACVLSSSVLLGVACGVRSAAAPADLHDAMKNVIAVQTQVVWDVGNAAQDDQGNPDASKLSAGDWAKIVDAAGKVKQASQTLARADHVVVAAPGVKIEGEGNAGAAGAKQVQAAIDANPAAFRTLSQALAASMEQIGAAAKAQDAKKVFELSGALDQVCEDCHMKFWYPQKQ